MITRANRIGSVQPNRVAQPFSTHGRPLNRPVHESPDGCVNRRYKYTENESSRQSKSWNFGNTSLAWLLLISVSNTLLTDTRHHFSIEPSLFASRRNLLIIPSIPRANASQRFANYITTNKNRKKREKYLSKTRAEVKLSATKRSRKLIIHGDISVIIVDYTRWLPRKLRGMGEHDRY